MNKLARGYIASGEYNGNRTPQHIQNQIVKSYCETIGLEFVLSRAEYWINKNNKCQLWSCLEEGYNHIVFFSLWQLPYEKKERTKVFKHCSKNSIELHFAVERISTNKRSCSIAEIEMLIETNTIMSDERMTKQLKLLQTLMQ